MFGSFLTGQANYHIFNVLKWRKKGKITLKTIWVPWGYTCHHFYMVELHMDVQRLHNDRPKVLQYTCNDIDLVQYSRMFRHANKAHVFHNSWDLFKKMIEKNLLSLRFWIVIIWITEKYHEFLSFVSVH